MDAASDGDTIEVRSGTYVENVDVDKRLTLVGDGADVVTVQAADASDHVFEVTVNWVNISGFMVTGATAVGKKGLYLQAGTGYCNISYNNVSNNYYGIHLYHSSNNTITGNNVNNSYYGGISLDSSYNNSITGNTVSNNYHSISLDSSCNNNITGNNVNNSYYDGISLDSSYTTTTLQAIISVTTTQASIFSFLVIISSKAIHL